MPDSALIVSNPVLEQVARLVEVVCRRRLADGPVDEGRLFADAVRLATAATRRQPPGMQESAVAVARRTVEHMLGRHHQEPRS